MTLEYECGSEFGGGLRHNALAQQALFCTPPGIVLLLGEDPSFGIPPVVILPYQRRLFDTMLATVANIV